MKLSGADTQPSFYESFSDLIFATMAIFVLLLMIALSVVKEGDFKTEGDPVAREIIKEQKEEIKELEAQLSKSEQDKVSLEVENRGFAVDAENQKITNEDSKKSGDISSQPLDLVVVIDISGSMSSQIEQLKTSIEALSKSLPAISPRVTISIIAYAKGTIYSLLNQKIEYDPEKLHHSAQQLIEFTKGLKAGGGNADIEQALLKALEVSKASLGNEGRQAVVVFGDVGPYEVKNVTIGSTRQSQIENNIVSKVMSLSKQNANFTMVACFTGNGSSRRDRASKQFFEHLAVAAGDRGVFTNDSSGVLSALLLAVLK